MAGALERNCFEVILVQRILECFGGRGIFESVEKMIMILKWFGVGVFWKSLVNDILECFRIVMFWRLFGQLK